VNTLHFVSFFSYIPLTRVWRHQRDNQKP